MTTMKSLSNHNVDHPASNISLVISFYHECVNNTHRDLYKILTCETPGFRATYEHEEKK